MSIDKKNKLNLTDFNTYEEFLDSQVTKLDLHYLEDEDLARELIELGYRGNGETMKAEDFVAKKQVHDRTKITRHEEMKLNGLVAFSKPSKLMKELAAREGGNKLGLLNTIIFIRDLDDEGQEISGYIDYSQRLKTDNFEDYFNGKVKLMPRHSDLSFFRWETQMSTSNSTDEFLVITDNPTGLLFRNKKDRKIINVDPNASSSGENSTRQDLEDSNYLHVVLFDHWTSRKH